MDETTEIRAEEQPGANKAENWLEKFNGQRVTVITLQGSEERTDPGELIRIAGGWVQLVKDNGEMILVPTTAIRIIKLLDMTQTTPGLPAPIINQTPIDDHIYEPAAQTP
ncbi:MAG: hypothetical protein JWL77_358 [Chthonomonadaceae bacterium]|nr:hypothetical protein [Chthonomonadaceae bacterium]